MKFWQSVAFTAPDQLVEIARGAEAAGFEGVLLSEHLFVPDAYAARYPYSASGTPDFDAQTPFPDPWVTMTAMAAATSRLRFATMVYILPLHHPLEVAKAVGTASILSGGRVVLGAGAGWMREEFEVLGVDFASRGKRFDECIEILRSVWRGGMTEHHGEIFDFDRLQQSPAPPEPIPIYIGGASKAALRRAARLGDGWLGAGNTPEQAEAILAASQADMCGMTRAMICDPEMPDKARSGRIDDVRACIGCNQACIGHFHMGLPISCIQHPETGREAAYGTRAPAVKRRRVLVAGGGPGGMKAAAVAAERGHAVTLYEAGPRLGGQALLAQLLPGRTEFGGIVTNLERELALAGVEVVTGTVLDRAQVEHEAPDAVIAATGARPRWPEFDGRDEAHVVDAWQVLRDEANVGNSVVIADWRCDWIGLGLAEKLARAGCRVRLCSNGYMAGQTIQQYVRDAWLGTLHKLGVELLPMVRLFGADAGTAYFQHTASGEAVLCEGMDTLVLAMGHDAEGALADEMEDWPGELHRVGDCLSPRTAEEAVLEGLKVGAAL